MPQRYGRPRSRRPGCSGSRTTAARSHRRNGPIWSSCTERTSTSATSHAGSVASGTTARRCPPPKDTDTLVSDSGVRRYVKADWTRSRGAEPLTRRTAVIAASGVQDKPVASGCWTSEKRRSADRESGAEPGSARSRSRISERERRPSLLPYAGGISVDACGSMGLAVATCVAFLGRWSWRRICCGDVSAALSALFAVAFRSVKSQARLGFGEV
jgi:hypothetical protein